MTENNVNNLSEEEVNVYGDIDYGCGTVKMCYWLSVFNAVDDWRSLKIFTVAEFGVKLNLLGRYNHGRT